MARPSFTRRDRNPVVQIFYAVAAPRREAGGGSISGNSRLQKLAGAAWLGPMPAKTNDKQDQPAETPHYHGHRTRLRERFHAAPARMP